MGKPFSKKNDTEILILENRKWAESIARAVARAWKLDPEVDGLIGSALEALVECANRFDPSRGIPFRAYARRRVHEAACDAARSTKAWAEGQVFSGSLEAKARTTAYELLRRFPELRDGYIPFDREGSSLRSSVRQLLLGATIIYLKESTDSQDSFDFHDYKKLLQAISNLHVAHQWIIWKVYWEGYSLRGLAAEWKADPLTVIREHQAILNYLLGVFNKKQGLSPPKVRPSLKKVISNQKLNLGTVPFLKFLEELGNE